MKDYFLLTMTFIMLGLFGVALYLFYQVLEEYERLNLVVQSVQVDVTYIKEGLGRLQLTD